MLRLVIENVARQASVPIGPEMDGVEFNDAQQGV